MVLFESDEIEKLVEDVINANPEPFADSSQLAMLKVSESASKSFKVALAGDGADELFLGYNRHIYLTKLWKIRRLSWLIRISSKTLENSKLEQLVLKTLSGLGILDSRLHRLYYKIRKSNYSFSATSFIEMYLKAHSSQFLFEIDPKKYSHKYSDEWPDAIFSRKHVQLSDINSYLASDILVKSDRASMYHGLEVRAPFLNPNLSNYSMQIGEKHLIKGKQSKLVLRKIAYDLFGPEHANLPKKGFSVPLKAFIARFNQAGEIRDTIYNLNLSNNIIIIFDEITKSPENLDDNFELFYRFIVLYLWLKKNNGVPN